MVEFTRLYRVYLVGRKFILRTDYGSLTWIRNFRDPKGQLARWLEWLQELDFDVVYRQGRAHTNADALSRLPYQQCGRENHSPLIAPPADVEVSATRILDVIPHGDSIRDVQLTDPILGPIVQGIEAGKKPNPAQFGSPSSSSRRLLQLWEQLVINNGVLCRRFESPGGLSSTMQIVVPSQLQKETSKLKIGLL